MNRSSYNILDEIDYKTKIIKRDEEGGYVMKRTNNLRVYSQLILTKVLRILSGGWRVSSVNCAGKTELT